MAKKGADVIIIGSGVAGLMTAHLLADKMNVILITKSNVESSNSSWAQGGMAAALGENDDWKQHFKDTILAGVNHHNEHHVEILVKKAPAVVKLLEDLGVQFDHKDDGSILLGMEGAHSQRRIVHSNGDKTGLAFTKALIEAVQDRVTLLEETMVKRLLLLKGKVVGVQTDSDYIFAKATVLATGGLGQLYTHTSNVPEATGDGFALAYRAGAVLKDMEFIQFHPTLFIQNGESFGLISEAVRGEGGYLVNEKSEKIMNWHPLKDLASRDVVSRTIFEQMQDGERIFLDCRAIPNIGDRFPGLVQRCQKAKVNIATSPIPVAPGAHFVSGGIKTDAVGQTSVAGLYAVGEVACTGVHGSNRLASNSLLEGMVFAEGVANAVLQIPAIPIQQQYDNVEVLVSDKLPSKVTIQQQMTRYVGIKRNEIGLMKMKQWLEPLMLSALTISESDTRSIMENKNMLITAWLVTEAALTRTESRGGHKRLDYPNNNDHDWLNVYIELSRNGTYVTTADSANVI